jgi:hypothetical protein
MLSQSIFAQFNSGGTAATGALGLDQVAELQKALTVGYGTDVSTLAGGAAFRIQSLDRTMMATIQENKHFRLFNELAKQPATATVDEWTEQSSVGGFLGGSTNSEAGNIAAAQGIYNRRVGLVKYLMTRREVSFVSTLGNNIVHSEAIEQQAGAKQLISDAEYLSFVGDSAVVPTEFDGIYAQIVNGINAGQIDAQNLVDAQGTALSAIDYINQAAAQVSAYGNFGQPTHIFCSQQVQADFDTGLDPAFRVPLTEVPGGGIQLGSPVKGIRTSWGDVRNEPDVFIQDENQLKPFEVVQNNQFAAIAAANNAQQPAGVAYAVGAQAGSQFTATSAGNYYYAVTGLNAAGQSQALVGAQQAVAAGNGVTITITHSAANQETGYAIYRSRLNGTNALTDLRLIKRIPVSGGATTVFIDLNADLPGSTKAFILNLMPGDQAITWRQLLPMLKFPLYPTVAATIPWAQLMFGYLRISKRRHHAIIKNIVPNTAKWKWNGNVAT